jgi:hypothetical protein
MTPYTASTAYFEQPGRCSLAADVEFHVRGFHQPCTLADLDGPDPRGTVGAIAETIAGPSGAAHLDIPLNSLPAWPRGAQAWLLVGRPARASPLTSPAATGHASRLPDDLDPKVFEARAIFDLP